MWQHEENAYIIDSSYEKYIKEAIDIMVHEIWKQRHKKKGNTTQREL